MALRQLFRETTTESSRMQEIVEWLFREIKTEAKRKQLHQDLAEATVTHLPCPSRVEVLKVLREHGFSGSLEETLDHKMAEYLFEQALTVSDEDKKALQISVGNVWDQGSIQRCTSVGRSTLESHRWFRWSPGPHCRTYGRC